jgi:hypothetical protein
MTSLIFLSFSQPAYPSGLAIAEWLSTALKRYKIQVKAFDCPIIGARSITIECESWDIIVLHNPLPDQVPNALPSINWPGKASLNVAHTRSVKRLGGHELKPPPAVDATHYKMGTIWLPFRRSTEAPDLATLPPLIRHAANWVTRHRGHQQSLELARIYAEAPLFATAF